MSTNMESKSKRSRDFSACMSGGNNNNSIILQQQQEEEETGYEICSSFVVAPAPNGDPQAIDKYLSSFPRGIRFEPHDYELVEDYLYKKINNLPLPINNIIKLDIYKHNPYDLAATYKPQSNYDGKKKWYFITPRDRKYPKGNRPNRAAGDGYWKATGADTPIECKDNIIGNKKALVFYKGKAKPPGGVKTSWIMYEYTIESTTTRARTHADDMRLDDYVLVRIHEKPPPADQAPKAKRIKAAVGDHADNNQIVTLQSPPIIENKATVDQITSMNHPSSNCDLLVAPVSNITNTNCASDGLLDEVGQLLSSSPDLQIVFSDDLFETIMSEDLVPSTCDGLFDEVGQLLSSSPDLPIVFSDDLFETIMSEDLVPSTCDSVYQGYQGNQNMELIMGADQYSNSSDGYLEGSTPDGSLYSQWYFNTNNIFASQTLNDVNEIFTELRPDGDLPHIE